MHNIKFRGKRIDNNKWVYGNVISDKKMTDRIFIATEYVHDENNRFEEGRCLYLKSFEVIPETIGQCTEFQDANGKYIYQNDILAFDKFEWYRSPARSQKDIEENEKDYIFTIGWGIGCWDIAGCYSDLPIYCKIIGNIYDNPELFKSMEDK